MCRCAQRREAIVAAAASAVRGDVRALAEAADFVVRSAREDVAALAKRMSARARLAR